jgi:hypothetical protein
MQKKSITYKEAIKAILYFLGVIYMIGSIGVLVRGPSNWKIDNHQGDLNLTRHNMDAAPLNFNLPNCGKNKRPRVICNKKLVCGNRKDPTYNGFSRYCADGSITEDQSTSSDQNKNKIYFINDNAQRIDDYWFFL